MSEMRATIDLETDSREPRRVLEDEELKKVTVGEQGLGI